MASKVTSFDLSATDNNLLPPTATPQPSSFYLRIITPPDVLRLQRVRNLVDSLAGVAALLSACLAIVQVTPRQNDLSHDQNFLGKIPVDTSPDLLRIVMLGLSCALSSSYTVSCVLARYYCTAMLHRAARSVFRNYGLALGVELVLSAASPPAWVDFSEDLRMERGDYSYSINDVCSVFALLKVYLAFRLLPRCVGWTSASSRAICASYQIKPQLLFVLKCELKHRPVFLISISLLTAAVIFGAAIRILERGFIGEGCSNDLSQLTNTMWLALIAMTTVGYGDGYPSTHGGRLVCAIAAIFGMILTSLMVVALTNFTSFSPAQMKAYYAIKKQKHQTAAVRILKDAFRVSAALRAKSGGNTALLKALFALRRTFRESKYGVT